MTDLASASLLYRHPDLYDELAGDDAPAAHLLAVLNRHHGRIRSLLDVGCGTGRHLAALAPTIADAVGVDLLPGMVAYARAAHPHLDVRQADMKCMYLGRTFDAITCLGFSINYLDDPGVRAALSRMAAHAAPGGLLVLQPMFEAPPTGVHGPYRSVVAGHTVQVSVEYATDGRWIVMRRRWQYADGRVEVDNLRRCPRPAGEWPQMLADTGWRTLLVSGDGITAAPPAGSGWVIAVR